MLGSSLVFTKPNERSNQRSSGFTILELMVATSVFAVILLVLTVGVLSFTRSYFASVTRSNTQAVARAIVNDITQSIQYGQLVTTGLTDGSGRSEGICVDGTLYSYAPGYRVIDSPAGAHQSRHGAVKTTGNDCSAGPALNVTTLGSLNATQHELLGNNMRLLRLSVSEVSDKVYQISVKVAAGEDDLLGISGSPSNWANFSCQNSSGSQFCAVSDITTTVQQRVAK